jgi:H+/Cl- antiporter ClcA
MLTESGIGLGAKLIPVLLPGFVAAAFGYLVFVGLGPLVGLEAPGLTVPDLPPYDRTSVVDLGIAVAVGLATAVIIATVNRGARRLNYVALERAGGRRIGLVAVLVAGGLGVGLIALLAAQLGANSQDVLFSGQYSIPTLIGETSLTALAVLLVAKALAYVISLATGFRGGPIFPALFLGIGVASFAVQLLDLSPTAAVAIGAAAGMAAQTRLVLTSMLFAALLVGTNGADAISAVVLATVAAWLTATAIDRVRPVPGAAGSQA